jgi:hypothetical protein
LIYVIQFLKLLNRHPTPRNLRPLTGIVGRQEQFVTKKRPVTLLVMIVGLAGFGPLNAEIVELDAPRRRRRPRAGLDATQLRRSNIRHRAPHYKRRRACKMRIAGSNNFTHVW